MGATTTVPRRIVFMRAALLVLLAVVALAGAATSRSAPTTTAKGSWGVECQHPTTTGVEVNYLKHVARRVACAIALSLHAYETSGHIVARCAGADFSIPRLVLHTWRGWRLSFAHHLLFLKRGESSFATSGTDFPVPC
jgi:hypothetical protein